MSTLFNQCLLNCNSAVYYYAKGIYRDIRERLVSLSVGFAEYTSASATIAKGSDDEITITTTNTSEEILLK